MAASGIWSDGQTLTGQTAARLRGGHKQTEGEYAVSESKVVKLVHIGGVVTEFPGATSAAVDPANPSVLVVAGPGGTIGGAPLHALQSWSVEDSKAEPQ